MELELQQDFERGPFPGRSGADSVDSANSYRLSSL